MSINTFQYKNIKTELNWDMAPEASGLIVFAQLTNMHFDVPIKAPDFNLQSLHDRVKALDNKPSICSIAISIIITVALAIIAIAIPIIFSAAIIEISYAAGSIACVGALWSYLQISERNKAHKNLNDYVAQLNKVGKFVVDYHEPLKNALMTKSWGNASSLAELEQLKRFFGVPG